jgi:predicted nucleic acid-binding Zn ribbon protein
MHKKSLPDKKTGAQKRRLGGTPVPHAELPRRANPSIISDLLSNKSGLARLGAAIPVQQSWVDWLRAAVIAELAGHIVNAVPKDDKLVVFADSAAWGTRLRYALATLQSAIAARDSAISHTTVRVQRQ